MERVIAPIAGRQLGNVARRELLAAGVSAREIERRVEKGALHPLFPGVYRVGHLAPNTGADYLAATLACGSGALLCGAAGGHHLALTKGAPPMPEVVAPKERRIQGIRTHHSRILGPGDGFVWRSVPVATIPWVLVDLAATLSFDDLARACHEAGVKHRTTPRHVDAVLERRPRAPGAGRLRTILRGDATVTLSFLERRFVALMREHGLPLPITNRPAGSKRVDCRWPDHMLIVELDSYTFHSSRHAWEQDRRREREARALGYEFRRYTYGDVVEMPRLMLAELRALLPHDPARTTHVVV